MCELIFAKHGPGVSVVGSVGATVGVVVGGRGVDVIVGTGVAVGNDNAETRKVAEIRLAAVGNGSAVGERVGVFVGGVCVSVDVISWTMATCADVTGSGGVRFENQ